LEFLLPAESEPATNNLLFLSIVKLQPHAIVFVQEQTRRDSGPSIQEPDVRPAVAIGDDSNSLAIAVITLPTRRIQSHDYAPGVIEAKAETLNAISVIDDYSRSSVAGLLPVSNR
jgi:hypothetical protein